MKVLLLGTGAADGWPTPFCGCRSCRAQADAGIVRRQSAALLDDVVLLDCGAEAPRSAVQAGRRLDALRLVLFTHAHPDHCDPQALLWRSWSGVTQRLVVAGPPDAIARCEDWVGPDDPVELVALAPGDALEHAGYRVRALAAAHTPGALLLDVTDPDGARLLYATDTGPLPQDTVDAVADAAFDAVLLECTWGRRTDHGTPHLDLDSFADQVSRLRSVGAVTATTRMHATHLGHRNPPEQELRTLLSAWGASPLRDHDVLDLRPEAVDAITPLYAPVPRTTFVLGGARSGKSRHAEHLLRAAPHVIYVATADARDDADWAARVAAHRERRPARWSTHETLDVAAVLAEAGPDDAVLVDCLTLWLARTMDARNAWDAEDPATTVADDLDLLVGAIAETQARTVLVSNEVGSGIVPEHRSGRVFRDLLGALNARVAAASDECVLVTAGKARTL